MIEIIKNGFKEIKTCNKCGCEFSFLPEDTSKIPHPLHKGILQTIVKCPQCNNEINVDKVNYK